MKITNLCITDAWSFCKDCPCDLTFDARNTAVIGKNNSGKSNILRCIQWIAGRIQHNAVLEMARNEVYDYGADHITARPSMQMGIELSAADFQDYISLIEDDPNGPNKEGIQSTVSRSPTVHLECGKVDKDKVQLQRKWSPFKDQTSDKGVQRKQQQDTAKLTDWLQRRMNDSITYLGGWRSLNTKVEGDKTIVKVMHEMQGADINNRTYLQVFDRVEAFFLKLTRLHTGQLRPTANGGGLNVRYRNRYLPIQSFGDGVVHTLLMAFEFMRKRDHVFLIEEPETHLHPELIRMLMSEIALDDSNQFIITTHSPVLLDSGRQSVTYCVEYNDDFSAIAKCDTMPALRHVLDVLDVRLSDLLQANCVIWVEGPTDRMFLNKCMALLDPQLIEGRHYQIAYYGGKLLAHYTADDQSDTLLNVLNLNRHSAVVADSDAETTEDKPNDTKQRLKSEIEKSGGMFWLTAGRELENYIADRVLVSVYQTLLPGVASAISLKQYERLDDVLARLVPNPPKGDGWKVDYDSHKTRLMPLFSDAIQDSDLDCYDLRDRLNQLVRFVQSANSAKEPSRAGQQPSPGDVANRAAPEK